MTISHEEFLKIERQFEAIAQLLPDLRTEIWHDAEDDVIATTVGIGFMPAFENGFWCVLVSESKVEWWDFNLRTWMLEDNPMQALFLSLATISAFSSPVALAVLKKRIEAHLNKKNT